MDNWFFQLAQKCRVDYMNSYSVNRNVSANGYVVCRNLSVLRCLYFVGCYICPVSRWF